MSESPVLVVENLHVQFRLPAQTIQAVRGVSFAVHAGETLAILGESGSGKSVSAQAVMGLIDPPGQVTGGKVRYRGDDLVAMRPAQRRRLNGPILSMVFQDALTALNPVFTVGWQIGEMLRVHQKVSRQDARAAAIRLMSRVGIDNAAERVDDFPHEFSGGMRQRVMIAIAIALNPDVLIADEPTTALDVTVQAQILELLRDLQREYGMALILITHDLGVVRQMADRVAVMYAGRIVESGPTTTVLMRPAHPYTQGLVASRPGSGQDRLSVIPGSPPMLIEDVPGCPFYPRCSVVRQDHCRTTDPPLYPVEDGRTSACHEIAAVLGRR